MQIVEVNIPLSPELEQTLTNTLQSIQESSTKSFVALERMASGLEYYARVQTMLLGILVVVCVLTLVILLVRDRQLRNVIVAAWKRLRRVS